MVSFNIFYYCLQYFSVVYHVLNAIQTPMTLIFQYTSHFLFQHAIIDRAWHRMLIAALV